MKRIIQIAKVELYSLFFSPVAWLVLVIFIFQSAFEFADVLTDLIKTQDAGFVVERITNGLFISPFGKGGFYTKVASRLFLYTPLLTMGLLSREINSGSIKLLYSSPVKLREIVFGKYLAMVAYSLLLILVLFCFVLVSNTIVVNLDLNLLLAGLLGFFLLLCSYCAVGLFMSSLTSYQVVAAISTFVVLAALNFLREVGQGITWIRVITYFLSLAGRTNQFIAGLITSRDVIYFFLVIFFFISLTYFKLEDSIKKQKLIFRIGKYVMLTAFILFVGYFTSKPAFMLYKDMTVNKALTLSDSSKKVLGQIKAPVTVTTFVNLFDLSLLYLGVPERRNDDLDFWQPYLREIPDLKFKYVYYYDTCEYKPLFDQNKGLTFQELAKKVADAQGLDIKDFLTPAQLKSRFDLSKEKSTLVRVLEVGKKKSFLRFYYEVNPQPEEAEIIAAFKRLSINPPLIAFVQGHNERSIEKIGDEQYKRMGVDLHWRYSLINQGFDVAQVSLKNSLPENINTLVLADPRTPLDSSELIHLRAYIANGGNVIFCGEPGKQAILNPVLKDIGVQFMDGMIVQQSKDFAPNYIQPKPGNPTSFLYSVSLSKTVMSGTVAIKLNRNSGFHADTLLETNSINTWNKIGIKGLDQGAVSYIPTDGDDREVLPLAISLQRRIGTKDQRILVFGDADFFSNKYYWNPTFSNKGVAFDCLRWLSYDAFPIRISRLGTDDNRFTIKRPYVNTIKIYSMGVVPLLLILLGSVMLISRRRK